MRVPANGAAPVRPFFWSVRRELWEYRVVVLAPIVVGAVGLLASLVGTLSLPATLRAAAGDADRLQSLMASYTFVALAVMVTGVLAGMFYAASAMQGERRDRGLLFWKSLPVSDTVAVLAKAAIPVAVLPVVSLATILAAQLSTLLWSLMVATLHDIGPAQLWGHLKLTTMWVAIPWALFINALWLAPVHAWLLLVSGWARRLAALWALVPFALLGVVERIALGGSKVGDFLIGRLLGGMMEALSVGGRSSSPIRGVGDIDPLRTFSRPDLWVGLAVAAALLAAAVHLRRTRAPP